MELKQVDYPRGNEKVIAGHKLVFAPLPLGAIEKYQDQLSSASVPITTIIDVAHISLKRNYPDIQREFIADEILDMANMEEVLGLIINSSGLTHNGEKTGEQSGE
ncbi:hypothetical protein [Acinetobacter larvae]|uniref:Uncharacterized protein n=1 Tax=Acinetobacter larvae TaxID=1789224 RepID=A0A1B2LZB8_9GAMM|nr:hypothetical protein [Acinetobacter larvae]AOA58276.1 hypothetical protein BFG52_07840 [Acinetobacter larvae]